MENLCAATIATKSGINAIFLCIKGTVAFDFAHHEDRLTHAADSKGRATRTFDLEDAFELIGKRFKEVREQHGGQAIGIFGQTAPPTRELPVARSSRVWFCKATTSIITALRLPCFPAGPWQESGSQGHQRDVFNALRFC